MQQAELKVLFQWHHISPFSLYQLFFGGGGGEGLNSDGVKKLLF